MNLSDYAEQLLTNYLLNTGSATRPTAWYVALHTGEPGETGASNEVSGNGYARQAVTFGAAASSGGGYVSANTGALNFTASGGNWGTITHMSIWDAVTAGNCLMAGALQQAAKAFTSTTADVLTVPGHGYSDTDRVVLYAGAAGSLPSGPTAGTVYFVRDSTTDTFKIATTSGGTAVDLTTTGSGVVCKIVPKQIDDGDTANFAIGALTGGLW